MATVRMKHPNPDVRRTSVEGQQYDVDRSGVIEVPSNHVKHHLALGFMALDDGTTQDSQRRSADEVAAKVTERPVVVQTKQPEAAKREIPDELASLDFEGLGKWLASKAIDPDAYKSKRARLAAALDYVDAHKDDGEKAKDPLE